MFEFPLTILLFVCFDFSVFFLWGESVVFKKSKSVRPLGCRRTRVLAVNSLEDVQTNSIGRMCKTYSHDLHTNPREIIGVFFVVILYFTNYCN